MQHQTASGYRTFVLPSNIQASANIPDAYSTGPRLTVPATHQAAETSAVTFIRACAALLTHTVEVRTVRAEARPLRAWISFTGVQETRTACLSWVWNRFTVSLDGSSCDLTLIGIRDRAAQLAALRDDPTADALTAIEQHRCAEQLVAHLADCSRHERIAFNVLRCAGCGRDAYRVRVRDRLCPRCRSERPPERPPVRTLAEAARIPGLLEFMRACCPHRIHALAAAERRGTQLDLFGVDAS